MSMVPACPCGIVAASTTVQAEWSPKKRSESRAGSAVAVLMKEFSQRETELQREAHEWKRRAEENSRARDQIVRRIQAARRDVYDANLRAEEAETRAREAETRAERAEIERDRVLRSTVWRASWPIRMAGDRLPSSWRRWLRKGA